MQTNKEFWIIVLFVIRRIHLKNSRFKNWILLEMLNFLLYCLDLRSFRNAKVSRFTILWAFARNVFLKSSIQWRACNLQIPDGNLLIHSDGLCPLGQWDSTVYLILTTHSYLPSKSFYETRWLPISYRRISNTIFLSPTYEVWGKVMFSLT